MGIIIDKVKANLEIDFNDLAVQANMEILTVDIEFVMMGKQFDRCIINGKDGHLEVSFDSVAIQVDLVKNQAPTSNDDLYDKLVDLL